MFTLLEGNRNHYIALNLARHLFLSILLLVAETDGRKPSFGDQSKVSFVIYRNPLFCSSHRQTGVRIPSFRDKPDSSFISGRCTSRPTNRRTGGNSASMISLFRQLSVSVVLVDYWTRNVFTTSLLLAASHLVC